MGAASSRYPMNNVMIATTTTQERSTRTESGLAAAFEAVLPREFVLADEQAIQAAYGRNVTALRRAIPLVVRPGSEAEVAAVIRIANELRVALYAISTGRNWGLGSKLPARDGCVLVDLSRMNRIIEVSVDFAYAIIEPGVTQLQLATYLKDRHPGLTFNFTGSFAHTSIVGNVLERGDATKSWASVVLPPLPKASRVAPRAKASAIACPAATIKSC
jgi:4-cresol dehydrogenase (hydroxylating)